MEKYEVIKKIMKSTNLDEIGKVYYIEMYLEGWYSEEEIKWIWEN